MFVIIVYTTSSCFFSSVDWLVFRMMHFAQLLLQLLLLLLFLIYVIWYFIKQRLAEGWRLGEQWYRRSSRWLLIRRSSIRFCTRCWCIRIRRRSRWRWRWRWRWWCNDVKYTRLFFFHLCLLRWWWNSRFYYSHSFSCLSLCVCCTLWIFCYIWYFFNHFICSSCFGSINIILRCITLFCFIYNLTFLLWLLK